MSDNYPVFDGFEIVRVLGKGGMGTVYLARDQRLGRLVALKMLNASDLAYDDRRARFLREARSAAAIRHQNVATIYEVDENPDGTPFIVMEYCEGETLSQRIRRRAPESGEFLSIARQLAAGIAAAHDKGILHRDIKSANIVVEPNGLAKILDFGLAKSIPRALTDPGLERTFESSTGHFFGTLHFISPEQARGQNADIRSDLFSLGVVLYHMAAGHLPFNADAPLLVLEKIRDGEPEPFVPVDPAFPSVAAKIISKLLQKNPEDRYQTARELLSDLEEIDTPTVRMTTSTSRTTLGRTIRRPAWIRVTATVLSALVVVLAIFLVRRGDTFSAASTTTAAPAPIKSMAVLPLRNIANSTRDEFLSVGLADALVTELQQIPSLQVRPTSAVLEFQGNKPDTKQASEKLQVDGILEGQFLAAGDLVRVTLQLTDSRTGYAVWSDSVNGRRDDLLKLIDDVSARTVSGLNERIGIPQQTQVARSQPRSANPKAYEQYLRARALNGSFEPRHYAEQINALKQAIALDPSFAAAYADLATTLSLGQARSLAAPEDLARAEWYARQAVRLDPNLPQAHLALGRVFVREPNRFRESVREVLAALRLESSDTQALHSVVTYFVSTGDLQKAQCVGDVLVKTDPMSNEALSRGYWNINAVDPEGALKTAQFALASRDTELAGHDIRGSAFLLLGNLAEADKEADAALDLVPRHYLGKSLKAMTAAARGNRTAALAHVKTFEADAQRNHWAALRVALVYAKLGDDKQALTWLRTCANLGNHSWYALVKHPWLAHLHSAPEFQAIVTQIKSDLDDVRDDVVGVYQLLCK
jgi:serine/threonine protein kinase/tetratricopeptide (TPR) repeat protein